MRLDSLSHMSGSGPSPYTIHKLPEIGDYGEAAHVMGFGLTMLEWYSVTHNHAIMIFFRGDANVMTWKTPANSL